MGDVRHRKVSVVPDGDDDAEVQPSDWNEDHDVDLADEDITFTSDVFDAGNVLEAFEAAAAAIAALEDAVGEGGVPDNVALLDAANTFTLAQTIDGTSVDRLNLGAASYSLVGYSGTFLSTTDPVLSIGYNLNDAGQQSDLTKASITTNYEAKYANNTYIAGGATHNYSEWYLQLTSPTAVITRPIAITAEQANNALFTDIAVKVGGTGGFSVLDIADDSTIFAVGRTTGYVSLNKANAGLIFAAANPFVQTTGSQSLAFITNGMFMWMDRTKDGLLFGSAGDTNLFRQTTATLETSGNFRTKGWLASEKASGTDLAFALGVTGDNENRFIADANGKLTWGSGAAAGDTNLYRSTANVLKTDDAFRVGDNITLNTNGAVQGTYFHHPLNSGNYVEANGTATVPITVFSSNNDAHASSPAFQVNGAYITIGDPHTAATFINGVGIKFHDASVHHGSIRWDSNNQRFELGRSDAEASLEIDSLFARFSSTGITIGGNTWGDDSGKWYTAQGVRIDGTIYAVGGYIGFGGAQDVNLYRSSANVLKTDDSFEANTIQSSTSLVALTYMQIYTDSLAGSNGRLFFGTAADTNLYRSAADTLKTDDDFIVGGALFNASDGGASGYLFLNGNSYPNLLSTIASDKVGFVIRGVTSQSEDLQQWQSITPTVLSRITSTGTLSSQVINTTGAAIALGTYGSENLTVTNFNARKSAWNDYGIAFYANKTDAQPLIYYASDQSPVGGGVLLFGAGGSTSVDTNLYRLAADTLATDDKFVTGGVLRANGDATLSGNATLAQTSVGQMYGFRYQVDVTGGTTTGSNLVIGEFIGRMVDPVHKIGILSGADATLTNVSGTTLDLMIGYTSSPAITTNSYVGEIRGFNVRNVYIESGSGATTQYGLYMEALSGAAANYAIYTAGSTPSTFGGRITSLSDVATPTVYADTFQPYTGSADITFLNGSASKGFVFKAAAAQTATLLEIRKSDNTPRIGFGLGSSQNAPVFTITNRSSLPAYHSSARFVLDSGTNEATQLVVGQDSISTQGFENAATTGVMVFANNKGAGTNFDWRTGITYNSTWSNTGTSRMTLSAAGMLDLPTTGSSAGITMANASAIYLKDSGGTARQVLSWTAGDIVQWGSVSAGSMSLFGPLNFAPDGTTRAYMDPNGQLTLDLADSGATRGLAFGSSEDTNLYRSGANFLQTDDSFVAIEDIFSYGDNGYHVMESGGNGYYYFRAKSGADTAYRFRIAHNGPGGEAGATLQWGPGGAAGALDTNLYRSAADTLKTDDTLKVADTVLMLPSSGSGRTVLDGWGFYVYDDQVTNDGNYISAFMGINAGGTGKHGIILGPGGGGIRDTNLYRDAANTLKTDDAFVVAGLLTVASDADSGEFLLGTSISGGGWDFRNNDGLFTITETGVAERFKMTKGSVGSRAGVGAVNAVTLDDVAFDVRPYPATQVGLVVRGYTAQSGDLQRWQNSTPTTLARVKSDGNINVNTAAGQVAVGTKDGSATIVSGGLFASGNNIGLFTTGNDALILSGLTEVAMADMNSPTLAVRGAMTGPKILRNISGTGTTITQWYDNSGVPEMQFAPTLKLQWGTALGTNDTNLYRSAATILATDSQFRAGQDVYAHLGSGEAVMMGGVGGSKYGVMFDAGATGDTILYRWGANILATDDKLQVAVGTSAAPQEIALFRNSDTSVGAAFLNRGNEAVLSFTWTGDGNRRLTLGVGSASGQDGTIEWHNSSGVVETNLYRSATNTLKTDQNFIIGGNFTYKEATANEGDVLTWNDASSIWVPAAPTGGGGFSPPGIDGQNFPYAGMFRATTQTQAVGTSSSDGASIFPARDGHVHSGAGVDHDHSDNTASGGGANLSVGTLFALQGDASDTSVGTQNNFSPTSWTSTAVTNFKGASALTITGLASGSDGVIHVLNNRLATGDLVLNHEDTNSSSFNRFSLPNAGNVTVPVGGMVVVQYNNDEARWRVSGSGLPGTQGVTGTTGVTGVTGPEGLSGLDGAKGATGVTGVGVTGVTGDQGVTGVTGTFGVTGVTGTFGVTGVTGTQGITGVTGAEGLAGLDANVNSYMFTVGGTLTNPSSGTTIMVWRAPFACVATHVRGHFKGGTSIVINARKNQASNLLNPDDTIGSADAWDFMAVNQNASFAAGDDLEIMFVTINGGVTEATIQVDLVKVG